MARKRKIPARKHHGVRDPLKQLEDKAKKLKNVINNPPVRGEEQKISKRFAQFKLLADNAKAGKKFKKIHSGREDFPKTLNKKSTNEVKAVKQFSGETDEDYLKRINRITTQSLKEAHYEAKYGVKIMRDTKTGEIKIEKKTRNEIDELLKQKQNERFKKGKISKNNIDTHKNVIDPKQAKALIKQAIKESIDEEKQESEKLIEYKHDVIRFGEVVHAPPTLRTLPRKAQKSDTVPRPGKKDNLLLKSLMAVENNATSETAIPSRNKKGRVQASGSLAQLKGKRKALPAATRNMLETEQQKIVELYRKLKKSKEKLL